MNTEILESEFIAAKKQVREFERKLTIAMSKLREIKLGMHCTACSCRCHELAGQAIERVKDVGHHSKSEMYRFECPKKIFSEDEIEAAEIKCFKKLVPYNWKKSNGEVLSRSNSITRKAFYKGVQWAISQNQIFDHKPISVELEKECDRLTGLWIETKDKLNKLEAKKEQ